MIFRINNLCKLQDIEIELNGITVLAGKNNMGKSTDGKALFCLFYSMENLEKKIERQKKI